jgi:hypothetical protein
VGDGPVSARRGYRAAVTAVVIATMLVIGLSTGLASGLFACAGYDRRTRRIKAVLATGGTALTAGATILLVLHSAVGVTTGVAGCALGLALIVAGELARHAPG